MIGSGVDPSSATLHKTHVVGACFSFRPLWCFYDGRCWSHSSRAMLPKMMVLVLWVLAPQPAKAIFVALESVVTAASIPSLPANSNDHIPLWTWSSPRSARCSWRLVCPGQQAARRSIG